MIPQKAVMANNTASDNFEAAFTWRGFGRGMRLALPLLLGYLPVAFAFGVLADKAGFNPLQAGLMSLFVYAGSSQLIAVDMLMAGLGAPSIILTTFVVNLRHLLMSAAVTPHLASWKPLHQALFSMELTDETFALHMGRFAARGVDKGEVFGVNVTAHLVWALGGGVGAFLGGGIGDVRPLGLDYALPAMFLALLLPHCRIPRRVLAALVGGGVSVFLTLAGAKDWSVIVATLAAATGVTACMILRERKDHA